MTRLWTADYSTGDFNQWDTVLNKYRYTAGYDYPRTGLYPAQIVSDNPDGGYCVRVEVRDGDVPSGFPTGDRCEMIASAGSAAAVGTTRWYAFSIKFDSTFPNNHAELGWGNVTQFHDLPGGAGSPVIGFGWPVADSDGYRAGYWYLNQAPQSAPAVFTGDALPIAELPMRLGEWQDIKLRVVWKQDTTGTVQLWVDGERQTFTAAAGGGTTWTGQTVCPSGGGHTITGVQIQQGYYRQTTITETGIVYYKGTRMADSEASL